MTYRPNPSFADLPRPGAGLPDPELHPEAYDSVLVKRFFAWVVDAVLIGLLAGVLVLFTFFIGLFILPLIVLSASFLYRWISLANRSATPGMRLMSLEVVAGDGGPLDGRLAVLHTGGYLVSCALPVLQLVSIGLMATSARGQGLTDHLLGTTVVNARMTAR